MSRISTRLQEKTPKVVKKTLFDAGSIQRRVRELADEIERDYQGRDLLLVGILKGACLFTCDLLRALSLPVEIDFIAISRYSPRLPSGEVKIIKDLQEDVTGKHLLLVEDIVDTGLTLHYLDHVLSSRKPASLSICTLLDRPDLRLVEIPIKYVGFLVSHEFLIGYGLDYRDHYRNLPYIATMHLEEGASPI